MTRLLVAATLVVAACAPAADPPALTGEPATTTTTTASPPTTTTTSTTIAPAGLPGTFSGEGPPRPGGHGTPPTATQGVRPAGPSTTTTAPDAPAPPPPGDVADVWLALADCESGDGDGLPPYTASWSYRGLHHGGLQFWPATWTTARRRYHERTGQWVPEHAYDASPAEQIAVARVWLGLTSPAQWPVCGPRVGLTMAAAA